MVRFSLLKRSRLGISLRLVFFVDSAQTCDTTSICQNNPFLVSNNQPHNPLFPLLTFQFHLVTLTMNLKKK
ncbi:hypothetical protein COCSADRAFT_283463 [Bipolaris sorokiniana ND90Pr]|uniref:Uncharacterized protein n=1 Tax=Cochliobolus sativus (strain ND90Pr / ATCC 201652) TaxID=665912 RepID=M2RJU7_COCSN|nr:uncharacterized protein COCSADRAFT_283463 [Bipolaris sorokiniana ND90Pr]EMD66969.1 hypothetical protein COCSADRAFT_283463 [Bipolaris sorokiniana ND90Pr]